MFAAATAALVVAMLLALLRALLGPSVYDRVLAVNAFGTKTMLMIAVLGFLAGRPDFMDIALLYALINFIGTLAVLKFFRYGNMARPGGRLAPRTGKESG
ncbi:MrpF/PhaF family protein [bacterium AH-315-B06]|nr:MrpF/PhaF family protein [bacterium AH-315-B06]